SGGRATGTLAVALSGSSAFTITADGCTARSLGPTKSCTVTVRYAPTAGGSDTATLTATGEHASASLTLTGSGAVAGHVYWTEEATGTIGRANLDGTGANQSFITGATSPFGVAVDAGHVYWTNFNTGTIGRADLDGTGVNQSFITGASGP